MEQGWFRLRKDGRGGGAAETDAGVWRAGPDDLVLAFALAMRGVQERMVGRGRRSYPGFTHSITRNQGTRQ